mgnify:CR=1 FL=1
MPLITYREALRQALDEEIARDENVVIIGEEVANDRMTVDEAAEEMDRRADRFLEKRRWMLDQPAKESTQ